MQEHTIRSIRKTLCFENSGDTFSVEITLENVSPKLERESIKAYVLSLVERAVREI